MIELTAEQRQQLETGQPIDIFDTQTDQRYIILKKDVFERVRHLLLEDSDWTPDELQLLLGRSSKDNGWDEPGMEAYDHYDEEVRKRCP